MFKKVGGDSETNNNNNGENGMKNERRNEAKRKTKRNFNSEQVELLLGGFSLLKRGLPAPGNGKEPFFALVSRSPEGWMAARGRGGGLALWTLRDSDAVPPSPPDVSSTGEGEDGA